MYVIITNGKFKKEYHCNKEVDVDEYIEFLLDSNEGFTFDSSIPDKIYECRFKTMKNIYWDKDSKVPDIMWNFHHGNTSTDDLVLLLNEMDRRLIQLWDKVTFERKHNLLNHHLLHDKSKEIK